MTGERGQADNAGLPRMDHRMRDNSGRGCQVIVLGAHRSGTSALTGALAKMGLFVGDEADLTRTSWENPKGFFERRDARAIGDALLHGSGADWWKVSAFDPDHADRATVAAQRPKLLQLIQALDARSRSWVLKEPRLCLLFPIVRDLLQRPFAVISCRHPMEAARSLRRRNGFPIRAGLALWEAYTIAALRHGRTVDHEIVVYDALIREPETVLSRLAERLEAVGARGLDPARGAATIEPGLRREGREPAESGADLTPAQAALWERLSAGGPFEVAPTLSPEALGELREFEVDEDERIRLRQRLQAAQGALAKAQEDGAASKGRLAEAEREGEALLARLGERDALSERLREEASRAEAALDRARLRGERARMAAAESGAELEKALGDGERLRGRLAKREALVEGLRAKVARSRQALDEAQRALEQKETAAAESRAAMDHEAEKRRALQVVFKHERRALMRSLEGLKVAAAQRPRSTLWLTSARFASIAAGSRLRRGEALTRSGLFDASWYLSRTLEAGSEAGAVGHYLAEGDAEGRDPHPLFSREWYVRAIGGPEGLGALTALEHYLRFGDALGVTPHPLFDPALYRAENPNMEGSDLTLLGHFVRFGGAEGRDPHADFDAAWYLKHHPPVARSGTNPLVDYLTSGVEAGRDPNPIFRTRAYLKDYPEVAQSGMNPLVHYVTLGRAEGYVPRARARNSKPRRSHDAAASELSTAAAPPNPWGTKTVFGTHLDRILAQCPSRELRAALSRSEMALAAASERLAARPERPLVSVVMPTFNRAAVLDAAIRSVLAQTYAEWELHVCDDGSTDGTEAVVAGVDDPRIHYHRLPKSGAAVARNAGLAAARGEIVAYLDSDNIWHPRFLDRMVLALLEESGRSCAYGGYIDHAIDAEGRIRVRSFGAPEFLHERLIEKNFIDLNTFVHRRELYDAFGGFDERLTRRQDYALVLTHTWLRDPIRVPELVGLYQRNAALDQITSTRRGDDSCIDIIDAQIRRLRSEGPPRRDSLPVKRVTILSWDLCRNHFAKPFALAEALSRDYQVQLVAFDFFGEGVFEPVRDVTPNFETLYLPGGDLPDFAATMRRAAEAIDGDVIYAVKPRLPSLGTALLANAWKGTPIILEINDLETVVTAPRRGDDHRELSLDAADPADPALVSPFGDAWTRIMDPLAKTLPVLTTHNKVIDAHFGQRCLYMRNFKDEAVYDPALHDRATIRAELGFGPDDRVLLFGGMLRKHKGIHEIVELVERLGDPRYKALFVGSRATPDQKALAQRSGARVTILPPQDRASMARINLAADLVMLWLDPEVLASHYQMPYKATDALAMGPAIIANDISDLGDLARQGYLRLAPFHDWDAMIAAVKDVFNDLERTAQQRAAARRLFERQFSYAAARGSFDLAARRALADGPRVLPAAAAFAEALKAFAVHVPPLRGPDFPKDDAPVVMIGCEELADDGLIIAGEAVAIVTARSPAAGRATAERLVARAGHPLRVVVAHGCDTEDFVAACNAIAFRIEACFIVYATEAAFPGADWLAHAVSALGEGGMLGFNDGAGDPGASQFGLVRREWVASVYGGPLFHPGYRTILAAAELAEIARGQKTFAYDAEATLVDLAAPEAGGRLQDQALLAERRVSGFRAHTADEPIAPTAPAPLDARSANSAIVKVDIQKIGSLIWSDPADIAVIMPCIDTRRGVAAAERLLARAGMDARVFVVEDTLRQGFIQTLNQTAARLDVRYVVYLAEDAFPGRDWLLRAYERLESTGKGLLAFNCGKWHGRIAAFGMVRKAWVRPFYGDAILFPGYRSHRADNELTVLARATANFLYEPEAVLVEEDARKIFRKIEKGASNFDPADRELFFRRFSTGFGGLVRPADLEPYVRAYLTAHKAEMVTAALAAASSALEVPQSV